MPSRHRLPAALHDKARALLPGGAIGDYTIPGFTETMLEKFGVSVDDFVATVGDAKNDEDIVAWVRRYATPGGIEAWNQFANDREIYNGDRAEAIADYPYLADHPDSFTRSTYSTIRKRTASTKPWAGTPLARKTPTTAMTHIAMAESLDGEPLDWMERVSNQEYLARHNHDYHHE